MAYEKALPVRSFEISHQLKITQEDSTTSAASDGQSKLWEAFWDKVRSSGAEEKRKELEGYLLLLPPRNMLTDYW